MDACKSERYGGLFPMSSKLGTYGCYHLGNGPQASWEIQESGNGIYVGQFDEYGNRHGQGVYIWDRGDVYIGEFENNMVSGHGTITYENGNVYTGDWTSGKQHGKTFAELWKEEVKEIKRKKELALQRQRERQSPSISESVNSFLETLKGRMDELDAEEERERVLREHAERKAFIDGLRTLGQGLQGITGGSTPSYSGSTVAIAKDWESNSPRNTAVTVVRVCVKVFNITCEF